MNGSILPYFLAILLPNFVFLTPVPEVSGIDALVITSEELNNKNAQVSKIIL